MPSHNSCRVIRCQVLQLGRPLLVLSLLCIFVGSLFAAPPQQSAPDETPSASSEIDHHQHSIGTIDAMTPHLQHNGPHMRWTTLRSSTADDRERAEQIVQTLRIVLAKYQDYRVALSEGYAPLHPERKTPHYHFANTHNRRMARRQFDASAPSAILYKKVGEGYELEGAMYTAPREMTEEQLNDRVPLSVAQWHAHINLCFLPDGTRLRGNRKQFGFKGTIDTEATCQQVGGRFVPQVGGWMIHVYPFKAIPSEIWTH